MTRKKQQAEMFFELGQLFGPLLKVHESPASYDQDERTRIVARFVSDLDVFNKRLLNFCLHGEPGHVYKRHYLDIAAALNHVMNTCGGSHDTVVFETAVKQSRLAADILMSIPVPVDSAIHEARTPFSTYCFVRDLCSTVTTKIVWLDRYFDQTIFHRFFTDTPKTALVTLVTLPAANAKSAGDKQRVAEFMDVSRLFAAERGQQGYRLIENVAFHDRWLQCDQKLFTLGGSIKDLSKPFTISRLDSTPDNLNHFDDVIRQGAEVFGQNHPNHL